MDHAPPVPPASSTPASAHAAVAATRAAGATEHRDAAPSAPEPEVRAALELMPQLVWTTTADGYHDYYNARWYAYTGMPRPGDPEAHAEGWNWKSYLHPDDYDRTVAVWAECLATGAPYEIEYRFKEAATGAYRWFLGRALPLRDADGRIVRWFGTCTDVDDQRRDAEQRRAQAAALAATNRQLEAQQAELEAQAEALRVTAARLAERTEAAEEAERGRARLLADLAAERDRLTALIRQMPAPLCLINGPDLRFAVQNDAFTRVIARGRDLTGLTLPEAFPELAGTPFDDLIRGVYATGEPWFGPETSVRFDRDGTGVADAWFDLSYQAVRDAAGRITGVLNLAVDVTDQVCARREVERLLGESERARADAEAARAEADAARHAAETANRAKSEFLAVMSHELRTPLNAIGGYAELIELGIRGPVTAAQRSDLARIQASQRHLLGLIAGVLDYSRVEAGAVSYRLADVPIAEAVAEAEVLVAPQLRAKGLGYGWSGAPPGLAVRADREKLQQILLNLLGNAIKFTDARDGAPGRVEVSCTVEDGATDGTAGARVALHVTDTGTGIAAEHLARVFEPFVQVDQRLTRPHAGVGLGLAISRDLARGMGGDLTVASEVGVGSTFTLTLPRA